MKHLLPFLFAVLAQTGFAQLAVQHPRTENLDNPIGLDIAQPRFSWQLVSGQKNVLQTAYEIRVSADAAGKNAVWNSGKIASDASVWVPYGGPALQSGKKYWWQVRVWDNHGNASVWSEPTFWQMGLLNAADWKAEWIQIGFPEDSTRPCPIFRKEFFAKKKITAATAYVTACGLYEAEINGKRVGDAHFTPGWTAYQKRIQYQAHDVTALLQNGQNAVGVTLGNGWWRGSFGFEGQMDTYGKEVALLFQLDIEYADGSRETVVSDGSWKCSTGPIRSSEIYHGELYDARLEQVGWSAPGSKDAAWSSVAVKDFSKENLVGTYNEPVRKHETFKPANIFKTPKGELVADFGQNLVGWVRLKVRGKSGDRVVLQFSEVLDKQGNFYTENLRAARATDTYILKGGGEETFEPHFTFHGFRYAKVEGWPGELKPEHLTAVALYSDMRPSGSFNCSNPLVNQLQHNIQWGQKGNFLDVPTDCPQRDERMGWTGDAQAFARTGAFNMDAHNFYAKWLKDIAADQLPNGAVPYVIPNVLGPGSVASTGWADAATIIPWDMYQVYGDARILADQYESMKAWVEYMRSQSKNDLWNTGFHFGDWLFYSINDDRDGRSAITDKYLIAQCFYAHSTQLLVNAAQVLGKKDDAAAYSELLEKIKAAYLKEYVTPNGRLVSPTQTAYVLALHFDMLPEPQREQAAKRLADNVKSYGNHLTTGFLGTPYLCHVLTRFGYNDLAYKLLNKKTYPSWLYPVTMGATTIWERWDGIKPDSTFQEASMNSFNHYAYGAIGDWMYRVVAGLNSEPDGVGYKKISVKPHPGGKLDHAAAHLQTGYGKLASHWKIETDRLLLDVEIPANTTATVFVPTQGDNPVLESGQPISELRDLHVVGKEKDFTVVKVGSGQWHFSTAWARPKMAGSAADYVGKYKLTGQPSEFAQVVLQDGDLILKSSFFSEELEPTGEADRFMAGEAKVMFVRNEGKKVVRIKMETIERRSEGERQ